MEISRELYTFNTSNIHSRVLRVTFSLESPSLCGKTAVYILNHAVPKIRFCPSYSYSFSIRSRNSILRELQTVLLYQLVPLAVSHLSDDFVLSQIYRLLSKTMKTMSPYTLYRWPLAAGQHHTMPLGKCGKHT